MNYDFGPVAGYLQSMFGIDVEVRKHKGYGDEGDFWKDDEGWEDEGEMHEALFEEQITDTTMSRTGFTSDADSVVWFFDDVANEGDKIIHQHREFIVTETNEFWNGDKLERQIAAVKTSD